ncbi:MAG: TIGR03016 family PEP-CTERM system-associated outer membrane protein, partial [Casimicrobiaceae bacterium]
SNALTASASSAAGRVGWKVDYARSYYDSGGDVPTSLTQSMRAELPVRIDPELVVGPVVGYERNRFGDQRVQSTIYGIVGQWRPTDRTNLSGRWEHRFFGSGYSLEASHRLPRVALSLSLARDVSTYPQRAQAFAAGASLASYVDEAFRTRIPDAGARALAVEQFLARSGLPATLLAPIDIFGTSFQLQTSARLSAALLGGRNSLGLSVFHVRSSALSATDQTPLSEVLPPSLAFASNSTQVGASVVYGYQLSGFTNFSASAAVSRVTAGDEGPANAIDRAVNANFSASIGTKLGVNTSGSVGVGYSRFLPQGGSDSRGSSAINVFAAVSHTFR